ncbi:hypothetical protein BDV96DRAFT_656661 [Lophiotrema nucula]|uniref:Piwi domain-containing protein n=1 Tax=Lophiotrema nucula TaxID=690887 RepID=A0A6A5ZV08_9PLEO|nr:hypothetical protein BDV96DRAFT_656661 [Lophiotrema nucula]
MNAQRTPDQVELEAVAEELADRFAAFSPDFPEAQVSRDDGDDLDYGEPVRVDLTEPEFTSEDVEQIGWLLGKANAALRVRNLRLVPDYGNSASAEAIHTVDTNEVIESETVEHKLPEHKAKPDKSRVGAGKEHKPKVPRLDLITTKYPSREALQTTKTNVLTNHFELILKPDIVLYEYKFINIPAGASKRKTKFIIKAAIKRSDFLNDHQDSFATDYRDTIIAWKKLTSGPTDIGRTDHQLSVISDNGATISLVLQFVQEFDVERLRNYITPASPLKDQQLAAFDFGLVTAALNTIVAKNMRDRVFQVSAHKYFVKAGYQAMPGSGTCGALLTHRGYYFNVQPGMGKLVLNLNKVTSAFYAPILVHHFLSDSTFPQAEREHLLIHKRVYIIHDRYQPGDEQHEYLNKGHNRIKTITAFGKTLEDCDDFYKHFKAPDGTWQQETDPTSVVKHLTSVFDRKVEGGWQAVNVGSKQDPVWYPAQFLRIMPFQPCRRALPDKLTENMLTEACQRPPQSRALIEVEGLESLNVLQDAGIQDLSNCSQITINPQMLKIPAVKMAAPEIRYSGVTTKVPSANRGNWNLEGVKFVETPGMTTRVRGKVTNSGKTIHYWVLVAPGLADKPGTTANYRSTLEKQVKTYGIADGVEFCGEVEVPSLLDENRSHTDCVADIASSCKKALENGSKAKKPPANLVVLILPSPSIPAYSAFKSACDRLGGCQSLVLCEKKNLTGNPLKCKRPTELVQYFGNVMMKINLKLGGRNHLVSDKGNSNPLRTMLKDTIVLGADVTHPGASSLVGCPSVAAIVGSVDPDGTKYLGSVRMQSMGRKEIIDGNSVFEMVKERIRDYSDIRRSLPQKVLYYRDGVSRGQYDTIIDTELKQIKKAFEEIAGLKPKLTAIVAVKRHNTRFYPLPGEGSKDQPKNQTEENGNCVAGTMVEGGITSPFFADFFLQSHHALQGTAIPCHYFVLENGMGLNTIDLQKLTHKLSYTYCRSTCGVSYAPPAYYADRLCERARCYLRDFFAPNFASSHYAAYAKKYDEIKNEENAALEALKAGLPQLPISPGRRKARKHPDLIQAEQNCKDAIEARVESYFHIEAAKLFKSLRDVKVPEGKDPKIWTPPSAPGPWKAQLDKTMFWM